MRFQNILLVALAVALANAKVINEVADGITDVDDVPALNIPSYLKIPAAIKSSYNKYAYAEDEDAAEEVEDKPLNLLEEGDGDMPYKIRVSDVEKIAAKYMNKLNDQDDIANEEEVVDDAAAEEVDDDVVPMSYIKKNPKYTYADADEDYIADEDYDANEEDVANGEEYIADDDANEVDGEYDEAPDDFAPIRTLEKFVAKYGDNIVDDEVGDEVVDDVAAGEVDEDIVDDEVDEDAFVPISSLEKFVGKYADDIAADEVGDEVVDDIAAGEVDEDIVDDEVDEDAFVPISSLEKFVGKYADADADYIADDVAAGEVDEDIVDDEVVDDVAAGEVDEDIVDDEVDEDAFVPINSLEKFVGKYADEIAAGEEEEAAAEEFNDASVESEVPKDYAKKLMDRINKIENYSNDDEAAAEDSGEKDPISKALDYLINSEPETYEKVLKFIEVAKKEVKKYLDDDKKDDDDKEVETDGAEEDVDAAEEDADEKVAQSIIDDVKNAPLAEKILAAIRAPETYIKYKEEKLAKEEADIDEAEINDEDFDVISQIEKAPVALKTAGLDNPSDYVSVEEESGTNTKLVAGVGAAGAVAAVAGVFFMIKRNKKRNIKELEEVIRMEQMNNIRDYEEALKMEQGNTENWILFSLEY